ncbi:PIN domain-like protein [Mycena olivaceomarginata]|nr:PIN domain-like protein [Mycena olivaceomarginata]
MGIKGLWKILADAAETRNLLQYTVQESFKNSGTECRPIIMGIDASIWMYQASNAIIFSNAQTGSQPAAAAPFYRTAALLALPIRAVFVFDGPHRPEFKRGTRVLTHGHWLTSAFRELIREFGYHSHTAPAEADAELGRLASEGIIDVVQTTDSDILLFGAPTVFLIPKKKDDHHNVTVYTAENIFVTPTVSLTRGGLLLIALLSGGDYDEGLSGCGIVTAHAVARGNLGDDLLHEALKSCTPTTQFLRFLNSWRHALALEFSTNPHGLLSRKHGAIAATIAGTPSFPNIDVIFAYVHPITSWSTDTRPDYHSWGSLASPNVSGIAKLCQGQLGWDAATISASFGNNLYLGIAMQSFLKPYDLHAALEAHVNSGFLLETNFPRSSVLRIVKEKTLHNLLVYGVEISTGALSLQVKSGLKDASAFPTPTLRVLWIPARIVNYALPDLLSRSKTAVKSSKPKSKNPRKPYGRPETRLHSDAGPSRNGGAARFDVIDLTSPEQEDLPSRRF